MRFLLFFLIISFKSFTQTVEITYDTPVEKNTISSFRLNGFNTGPALNELFESSPTIETIQDYCGLLGPVNSTYQGYKIKSFTPQQDFVEKTHQIYPSLLRFPGGTIANYYHLYEYDANAVYYDHLNPTFAKGFGTTELETRVYNSANVIRRQYCRRDNIVDTEEENENYIVAFSNLVGDLNNKIQQESGIQNHTKVIYVANLLSHFETKVFPNIIIKNDHLTPSDPTNWLNILDPQSPFELYYNETKNAIQYLIDQGIEVVGVELGNELYFGEYKTGHSNVTENKYMQLAHIYSVRLKHDFPFIKTGVVTNVTLPMWHSEIANYQPSFYDAIILHEYYEKNTCLDVSAPCDEGCNMDFVNNRECRFECGECALSDYAENDFTNKLVQAKASIPQDKKIWITEWNLIPNSIILPAIGNNLDYTNTLLHAGFVFDLLHEQLKFNAQYENTLEYSTHHRIGYKLQWSVVQTELGHDTSRVLAAFHAYKVLNDLFLADSVSIVNTTITSPDQEGLKISSFLLNHDQEKSLFITFKNTTSQPISTNFQSINSITIDNEELQIPDSAIVQMIQGSIEDGLYSSNGITKFNNVEFNNSSNPSLDATYDSIASSDFVIPPFSLGSMTLKLNSNDQTSLTQNNNQSIFIEYFPNPTSGKINMKMDNNNMGNVSVKIQNLLGKEIKQYRFNKNKFQFKAELDLSNLNLNGFYLIEVEIGSHKFKDKILIIK